MDLNLLVDNMKLNIGGWNKNGSHGNFLSHMHPHCILPLQDITTQAEIQVVWQRADRSPVVRNFLDVVKAHIHAESAVLSDAPD
jgi:hypothetical protein